MEPVSKDQVAALLKDARAKCRKTVEEVSESLRVRGFDIQPRSLYNYENAVSSPPVPLFLALCDVYELWDIFTPSEAENVPQVKISPSEEKLLDYFRSASPELRSAALRVLQPEKENRPDLPIGAVHAKLQK